MKIKLPFFLHISILLSIYSSYGQDIKIDKLADKDSLSKVISEIIRTQQKSDSLHAFAMVYEVDMPEKWYALFSIDTIKGELIWANSYVYLDKIKYLTKYYFYKNKLIATETSKSKIKNQNSDKYSNWERNLNFWNNSLISSYTNGSENFDFKEDMKIASELMECFKRNYTTKKLYFDKGTNIGRFR